MASNSNLNLGEIASYGDRIVWCTVTPSNGGTNVDTVVYTPIPIDDEWIAKAKQRKDPIYLAMGFRLAMSREAGMELKARVKPFRIRMAAMGYASVLQYYDVYEMEVPLWRRLLSFVKPIRIYGYKYKDGKIVMAEIEFRGLSLKPRIAKQKQL